MNAKVVSKIGRPKIESGIMNETTVCSLNTPLTEMTYQGKNYHPGAELEYLEKSRERLLMHPETLRQLEYILTMLKDRGENETFRYLREEVLKNKPFPWEASGR